MTAPLHRYGSLSPVAPNQTEFPNQSPLPDTEKWRILADKAAMEPFSGMTKLREDLLSTIPFGSALQGMAENSENLSKGIIKGVTDHPVLTAMDALPLIGGGVKTGLKLGFKGAEMGSKLMKASILTDKEVPIFSRSIRKLADNLHFPEKATFSQFAELADKVLTKAASLGEVANEEKNIIVSGLKKLGEATNDVVDKSEALSVMRASLPKMETKELKKWNQFSLGLNDEGYKDLVVKYKRPMSKEEQVAEQAGWSTANVEMPTDSYYHQLHWPNEADPAVSVRTQVLPQVEKEGHFINTNLETQSDPKQQARRVHDEIVSRITDTIDLTDKLADKGPLYRVKADVTPEQLRTSMNRVADENADYFDDDLTADHVREILKQLDKGKTPQEIITKDMLDPVSDSTFTILKNDKLIEWNPIHGSQLDVAKTARPDLVKLIDSKGFKTTDLEVQRLADDMGINLIPNFPFMHDENVTRLGARTHLEEALTNGKLNPDGSLTVGVATPDIHAKWWAGKGHEQVYGKKGDMYKGKELKQEGLLLKAYKKVLSPFMDVKWDKTNIPLAFKWKDKGVTVNGLRTIRDTLASGPEAARELPGLNDELTEILKSRNKSNSARITSTELFTILGPEQAEVVMNAAHNFNAVASSTYEGKRVKLADVIRYAESINDQNATSDLAIMQAVAHGRSLLSGQTLTAALKSEAIDGYVDLNKIRSVNYLLAESLLDKAELSPILYKGKVLKPYEATQSKEPLHSFTIPPEVVARLKKEGLPFMAMTPLMGLDALSKKKAKVDDIKSKSKPKSTQTPASLTQELGNLGGLY